MTKTTIEFPTKRFDGDQAKLHKDLGFVMVKNGSLMEMVRGLPRYAQEQILYDMAVLMWEYVQKFAEGVREHGTNIDEMHPGELVKEMAKEQIDQIAYRLALERQTKGHGFK